MARSCPVVRSRVTVFTDFTLSTPATSSAVISLSSPSQPVSRVFMADRLAGSTSNCCGRSTTFDATQLGQLATLAFCIWLHGERPGQILER